MISILKRIRLSAINSSKVRQYLLYALGEISLIVIGIVLAVQINAWKQDGQDRSLEQQYLERILEEVEANKTYFELNQLRNDDAKRTIDAFALALATPDSNPDSLVKRFVEFVSAGAMIPKYTPTTATYDDLASTGNLSLIKDPSLRESVNLLYSLYIRNASIHEGNRDWVFDSDGRILDHYMNLKWDHRTRHLFVTGTNAEEASDIRRNADPIMANAAIHYWVIDRVQELNAESIEMSAGLILKLRELVSQD